MSSCGKPVLWTSKFLVFSSVLLLFNIFSILCVENNDTQATKSESVQREASPSQSSKKQITLRLCATHSINLESTGDSVELPTYFTDGEHAYLLDKYIVDKNNPLSTCPSGKPLSELVSIVPKEAYDEEYNPSSIFVELLRGGVFLFDNGYLSVGNYSEKSATYYSPNEFCIEEIQGKGNSTEATFRTCPFSSNRPTLAKCCPIGLLLEESTKSCTKQSNINKWDPEYMDAKSLKLIPVDKANPVFTSPLLSCINNTVLEPWEADGCNNEFHPMTDNTIAFIGAHRGWEYLDGSLPWCMDFYQPNNKTIRMTLIHCVSNVTREDDRKQARISLLYMVSMYIGAGFHFMTTLVYLITWAKQNIHGRTLCSCTASLFFMQIFMGTAHLLGMLKDKRPTFCIINGIGGQYFMIAAFTWLVVVNFDLWRTFRSIRADGSKSLKRLLMFSAFGWGFPLLVSVVSVSLDFSFPCRASGVLVPEFGEHYCFVSPWSQGAYVYYILGFVIAVSCVFSVLTLIGLYNFKKDAANLRSNKRAVDQQNVLLFLKLSVVMGLTWVFEVISWAATKENENHVGWIIIDLYNALSAILIFIIFVCKKSQMCLLENSMPCFKGLTAAVSKFAGESSTDNTQSTGVGANGCGQHKRSIDQPVVRYTKEEREPGASTD